ncbi:31_t:CDS:2, partial [Racocetra fulgida]
DCLTGVAPESSIATDIQNTGGTDNFNNDIGGSQTVPSMGFSI